MVRFNAHSVEVLCDLFCELDCKDGDQRSFAVFDPSVDFAEQICHLATCRSNFNFWIEQPCWPNFHLCNAIDVLDHMVQGFTVWVLLFDISRSSATAGLCVKKALWKWLIGQLAQMA